MTNHPALPVPTTHIKFNDVMGRRIRDRAPECRLLGSEDRLKLHSLVEQYEREAVSLMKACQIFGNGRPRPHADIVEALYVERGEIIAVAEASEALAAASKAVQDFLTSKPVHGSSQNNPFMKQSEAVSFGPTPITDDDDGDFLGDLFDPFA